jgi:hypothetical protein
MRLSKLHPDPPPQDKARIRTGANIGGAHRNIWVESYGYTVRAAICKRWFQVYRYGVADPRAMTRLVCAQCSFERTNVLLMCGEVGLDVLDAFEKSWFSLQYGESVICSELLVNTLRSS